jgi:hypothetical protein
MSKNKNIKDWLEMMEKGKGGTVDLSRDEDLSIAIMNLISLEEHLYFTTMKTDNGEYLEIMKSIREMRKRCLAQIVKDPVGEEWCISKHLLAGSMRLYEVGVKELSTHGEDSADKYFRDAFELWSLFFAINLKLIDTKKIDEEIMIGEEKGMSKFSTLMKKIIDCCKEW